jgi:colanic acid/amylovoran biosynthesis glycosyltransferase
VIDPEREMRGRPTVAFLYHSHLPATHTFIYEYLTHLRGYRPTVLAVLQENASRFPFADVYTPHLSRWQQWLSKISRRTRHRQLPSVEAFFCQAIRDQHSRLIHAHFGDMGVYALPICAQTGRPLAVTFYGRDMSALARQPYWQRDYRRMFEEAGLIFVEGPYMRRRVVDLGCPDGKIRIQRIGIELGKFPFRPRRADRGAAVRILMAGRFQEKKGLEYGIRAFARVAREWPAAELRIVGDGPLRRPLEALAGELNLARRAIFLGFLTYEQYAAEAAAAHIFLAPSVTARNGDSEGGAPTVILEMQAAGVPVVATRHADIPFVVAPENSHLLVPERDAAALAESLAALLANPDHWAQVGRAGREFVAQAHDIRLLARSLEERYDELLASRPASQD